MSHKLVISLSPHEKGSFTLEKIMWGVVIALIPSFLTSIYFFGLPALLVILTAVIACVVIETFIQKYLMKQMPTYKDGSAVITGLLLAFNLPSNIPLWQVVVGAIVAIGISKMVFGGLGKNPFNPALIGRAFMLASFPVQMTTWPLPQQSQFFLQAEILTGPTPLGIIKEKSSILLPSYWDMFIGNIGGCLGEVSALAILIGGLYLLYKKIITWHIPFFYLLSLAVFTGIFWKINPNAYQDPLFHLLSGGAMLGAWFMATDMVTNPMTIKGQIIFAIGGGLLCGLIRLFGSYPEGCSYSILIMNAFVPLIDKYLKPRRFGKEVNFG